MVFGRVLGGFRWFLVSFWWVLRFLGGFRCFWWVLGGFLVGFWVVLGAFW